MADTAKSKVEESQNNEETTDRSDSDVESGKDKKNASDKKSDKKNASVTSSDSAVSKIKPPAKKRVKAEQVENNKDKEKKEEPKKKKAKPAASKVKEGDDEESEGEENGIPDKIPLLDQPLEISGSRERKQVERFIPKENLKTDLDKKIEIPQGEGTNLGDIPRVQYQINKLRADNLKILHRILYNRVGSSHLIKKNILKFNGFDFKKDSTEYRRKLAALIKLKNADLKNLCTILDLTKGGRHNELAERISDYLVKPEDSGKEAPDPRPTRKGASSKSYKELKTDDDDDKKKNKSKQSPINKKKLKTLSEEEDDDDEQPESGEDEKKTDDDESAESEEDKPKKIAKKRAPPPKKAAAPKATKKKATSKGTAGVTMAANKSNKNKENDEKEKSEDSDDESDNEEKDAKEPLAKKNNTPPTDDEITSYVKSILDGADLKEITMNTVCSKVYEHYPDFDLSHKKKLIKKTVKSLIMT